MKRLLFTTLGLALALDVSGQGMRISGGVELGYFPGILENQTMNDTTGIIFPPGTEFMLNYSYQAISLRAFCDLTYVLLSVGYRTGVSRFTETVNAMGASASADFDFSIDLLELRALAKYPFRVYSLTIWPMAGIEFADCLNGTVQGVNFSDQIKKDYSDISIIAGLGIEFKLSRQFYFRPSIIGGYNLTSQRNPDFYTNVSYVSSSGMEIEFDMSVGYVF